jgi:hypothetical protein
MLLREAMLGALRQTLTVVYRRNHFNRLGEPLWLSRTVTRKNVNENQKNLGSHYSIVFKIINQ